MENTKIPPTKSDKTIGWVFIAIGALGILYAISHYYSLHISRPGYTVSEMIGGIVIGSLIPLLFISSGRYYLSGKNAARKAKKGQESDIQPQAPSSQSALSVPPENPRTNIPDKSV